MKGGNRSRKTTRRVADGSAPESTKPIDSTKPPEAEAPREVATAEDAAPRRAAKAPVDADARRRLASGQHGDPHTVLGAHAVGEGRGIVVRAFHPDADGVECLLEDGPTVPLDAEGDGLFAAVVPDASLPLRYRLRFRFADGNSWDRGDPYRFWPTLGDVDLHLFNEGKHRRLWEKLGAHPLTHDAVDGVAFAVWAPNARRASVIGEFCGWDGRLLPMRQMGSSGVWELFVPELPEGSLYKYEFLTQEGAVRVKTDPFAASMERPPATGSRVFHSRYRWGDEQWLRRRSERDPAREPMAVYEVHLGSWRRVLEEGNRSLRYREAAPRLAEHLLRLGFTHAEFLPIMEHPFEGSWGYQVSGYYAPSARFGDPDDFRFLVDTLHQAGIGVILDWVPAHFPKDDFALRRFDGTALYEHEDPRRGEHPDWGTLIFNYGRNEVRNFLTANALYWLDEFHVDALRVDAVASMLYLDYSRKADEWIPNRYGGRENLDAIEFFRSLNEVIREEKPGCFTVAEESTSWPGVTKPAYLGGLGFAFKWNMGWMHDTLNYFAKDAIHRPYHHDQLTFAMLYEYSERFVMPLSHDEVVHLKGALLEKMPGDLWRKFANLRLLLAYMYSRPGKMLLFMGAELAPYREWNHDQSLPWDLQDTPERQGLARFFEDLGRVYRDTPCFWRRDHEPDGFSWIDCNDRENSIVSYQRRDGEDHRVVICNFTPVAREDYRIGVPRAGEYVRELSSDEPRYGGSQFETLARVATEPIETHGHPQSVRLRLPPLGALILKPA